MLTKPANRPVSSHIVRKLSEFRSDEGGAMAIFILLLFVVMLMIGGIAVDVMRFETRRVTLQQTLDRAVLASASMNQKDRTPKDIATEWFRVAGLKDEFTVDYSTPALDDTGTSVNARKITAIAKVRSYNHFMGMFHVPYFQAPVNTGAAEGIANVEVMLVLDITGSMNSPASSTDTRSKIAALRDAASKFVTIVKGADTRNGVSIGIVPYASQVNIPADLRKKYAVTHVSSWDFVANQGVPDINCVEIPKETYGSTGLSTKLPMAMAAIADTGSSVSATSNYLKASDYPPSTAFGNRICTTKLADPEYNQVLLPTKDKNVLLGRIDKLTADGNTSIAIGMRWGTALIDETASDVYKITDSDGKVRPFKNNDATVRKIIVLMTDGEHVPNTYVKDDYKSGPSPIWRGSDGRYAMNFGASRGPFTGDLPLGDCSGWKLATDRVFFIPHLKRDSVKQKDKNEPEGQGKGADVTGACDPLAWSKTASWPALDGAGKPLLDANGKPVTIVAQQLDWSEVYRFLQVEYVLYQMYRRANITNRPLIPELRATLTGTYLQASEMDTLLQQNCSAARAAGIEIYGIALAAPANGQTQIQNCATANTKEVKYYHAAASDKDLTSAFSTIASDITDLRLTQ